MFTAFSMRIFIGATLATVLACTAAHAQLVVKTGEGGAVKVDLGYNVVLNKNSSLRRQWVYIHDPKAPVEIDGSTDIGVRYKKDYNYGGTVVVRAKQDVTAVEVVHVILDVFGRRLSTLQNMAVLDIKADATEGIGGDWRIWSETEASSAHTSYTYVRSVRTADGKVYFAPMSQVFDAIRKGAPSLSSSDIEPKKADK